MSTRQSIGQPEAQIWANHLGSGQVDDGLSEWLSDLIGTLEAAVKQKDNRFAVRAATWRTHAVRCTAVFLSPADLTRMLRRIEECLRLVQKDDAEELRCAAWVEIERAVVAVRTWQAENRHFPGKGAPQGESDQPRVSVNP